MNIYPFSLRQLGYSKQKIPPKKTVSPMRGMRDVFEIVFKNPLVALVYVLPFSIIVGF